MNPLKMDAAQSGFPFDWREFTELALSVLGRASIIHERLVQLLSEPSPAPERMDEIGRPLGDAVIIREHPDVSNFIRVLEIRRQSALQSAELRYLTYADGALKFLNQVSAGGVVFVIIIAAEKRTFEFFYSPLNKGIHAVEVGGEWGA